MKICQVCKIERDLTDFHKNASRGDGLEARCKSCRKLDARAKYLLNPFKTLNRIKKSECKKKGLPFDLTEEYLNSIWTGVCPISGDEITIGNAGRGSHASGHLDRLIPKLGYVQGNVKFISGRMNRIKYNATVVEIEALLAWMKSQESATTIETNQEVRE